MLSVGVVTSSGVGYYLETVGSGVDDYYARTEPGRWTGRGATALGLTGQVAPAQVDALAGGANPVTGEGLGMRVGKVAAFDLTFSAPKSVSLLAELADPQVRAEALAAHNGAVSATFKFLEDEGVFVGRRGLGGTSQVATAGAVAAGFVHRTSRAGDPQLHTHLLVFNRAQGDDGRWGGVWGRRVFAWAKPAGYVYQAALRAELSERLGVEWRPVVNGTAEMAGLADTVLDGFSTRRAQIEQSLAETGFTTAKAAQVATLATRPAKPEPLDPDIQRARWWEQATGLGMDPDAFTQMTGKYVGGPNLVEEPRPLGRRLAGPAGLTEHRSTFDRRAVVQAVAEAHRAGAHPDQLADMAGRVLTDPGFVEVGRDHPLAGPLYSTRELVELEQTVVDSFERRQSTDAARCGEKQVVWAIADRPTLSEEQAHMVRRLCCSGDGVQVVVGRAGTGKTYALDTARAAWTANGTTVIGAALAARTAAGLQAGTGIPSTTIDQLLTDLARPGPQEVLPRRGVLVVDEAGMVGTRKLAALTAAAERSRTKVVLVGDPRQLPEVEAGGVFAVLAGRDPIQLTVNRRQAHEWERAALDQLRHGDVTKAVTVYRDRQRITLTATAEEARDRLVGDWWQARETARPDAAVMIALHQADVHDLNALARQHLDQAGQLAGPRLQTAGGCEFAVGDRVMALRNDRRVGVTNGTRATVTGINADGRELTVDTFDGRTVTIPATYLDDGHLTYGYAMTAHKAQGMTVERAFVLGSDRLYREAGYTALSRAVQRSDLYQVAPTPVAWQPAQDPHDQLTHLLSRSAAQETAITHTDRAAVRDAALADPGDHLIDRLGPPPPSGRARDAWAAAATAIDTYRQAHHIAGPDLLGPAPDDPQQRHEWDHANTMADHIERTNDLTLEADHGLSL